MLACPTVPCALLCRMCPVCRDLLTTECEVLEYDPDYFGGLSPVFDFKRGKFMRWSPTSFRKGYSAQVRRVSAVLVLEAYCNDGNKMIG